MTVTTQKLPSIVTAPLNSAIGTTIANFHSKILKPFLPAFFFFAGVTYDTLTLTRIDRLFDNLILLLYLVLLGTLIILTGRLQLGLVPAPPTTEAWNTLSLIHRARPHLSKAVQFLLGGLFSAYVILYSQSASFSTTAIFLGIIVGFLIANEFLQNRYANLKILMGLFAVVTLSFLTFFLPVLTGWMNDLMFVTGAGITVAVVWRMIRLILHGIPNIPANAPVKVSLPAFAFVGICTTLYFLNWIPPIPLSLKFGGVYHDIKKHQDRYVLTYEEGPWYAMWKESDDRIGTDIPVYAYASVFAPVTLQTTIVHHWEWQPVGPSTEYHTTDRIPIPITGGREAGYRMYTRKQRLLPGEWRVNVETEDGRLIGRFTFCVVADYVPSHGLTTLTR